MRLDNLPPRTWLIAGVAGWAVLAWLLAVAGMGGRVQLLADDPDLLVALPQVVAAQASLGPADQYQAIAERPLFASDRRPHPFFLEGGEDRTSDEAFDYVLTSVLLTPKVRLAIVHRQAVGEPLRVKLDEPLAQTDWRLVELTPRSAVFEGAQGRRSLDLKVFDGTGGEPVSAALETGRAPPPAAAARAPEVAATSQPQRPQPERQPDPSRTAESAQTPADNPDAKPDATDPSSKPEPAQAQMDAIRQRIEARRAALRKDEL